MTTPPSTERGPSVLARLRSLAPVIAAALCIPCVVLLVLFTMRLQSRDATENARKAALRSARAAAVALLAYDYRHITSDVSAAKKLITKPFTDQYAQTTSTLLSEAPQLKAIVRADVRTVAIEDASRDRAVVLLFVDQSSVKQLPKQTKPVARVDEQHVRMTLVRSHGQWLVSELSGLF
ncbi:MAG: hypothetical protein ACJ735_07605 [Actinomycetes bacterium]